MEGIVGIYKGYKSHWGYVLALDIWENLGWVGEEAHFQPRKAEYLISGYTRYLWLAIFLKSHMQSCRQDIWLKGDFEPWQGKKNATWKFMEKSWNLLIRDCARNLGAKKSTFADHVQHRYHDATCQVSWREFFIHMNLDTSWYIWIDSVQNDKSQGSWMWHLLILWSMTSDGRFRI